MAKIPNNNNAEPLRVAPAPASSLPVTHEEALRAEEVANGLSTPPPSASASFASSHTPRSPSSPVRPLTPLGDTRKSRSSNFPVSGEAESDSLGQIIRDALAHRDPRGTVRFLIYRVYEIGKEDGEAATQRIPSDPNVG